MYTTNIQVQWRFMLNLVVLSISLLSELLSSRVDLIYCLQAGWVFILWLQLLLFELESILQQGQMIILFVCSNIHLAVYIEYDHGDRVFKYRFQQIFEGHPRSPLSIRWHPKNPNILATSCLGSSVFLWDISTGEAVYHTVVEAMREIRSIDFHPSYELLFSNHTQGLFVGDWNGEFCLFVGLHCMFLRQQTIHRMIIL